MEESDSPNNAPGQKNCFRSLKQPILKMIFFLCIWLTSLSGRHFCLNIDNLIHMYGTKHRPPQSLLPRNSISIWSRLQSKWGRKKKVWHWFMCPFVICESKLLPDIITYCLFNLLKHEAPPVRKTQEGSLFCSSSWGQEPQGNSYIAAVPCHSWSSALRPVNPSIVWINLLLLKNKKTKPWKEIIMVSIMGECGYFVAINLSFEK